MAGRASTVRRPSAAGRGAAVSGPRKGTAGHRGAHLGDFTVQPRMLVICGWALLVGGAGAVAALALSRLIGLVTNAVFCRDPRGDPTAAGQDRPDAVPT